MFRKTIAAVVTVAALVGTAAAQIGFEGPFASDRWIDTGLADGTTEVRETVELFYDVVDSNPQNGVSYRSSTYSTIAEADGLIRIYYDARFRHASYHRYFFLQAFVETSAGFETVTLIDEFDVQGPTISPDFEGAVELNVEDGYEYGFIIGGAHHNSNPYLNGNLVFWELDGGTADLQTDASQWTAGPIFEGTTGVRPALVFDYFVDLFSGGVPFRTTDLTAYSFVDGQTEFNWTYRANHNTFAATAKLDLIAESSEGGQAVSLVDEDVSGTFLFRGRNSIDVESSNVFGIRVGGSNISSGSTLDGVVILSRFGITESEPCMADLNDDGLRDLTDINMFVNSFTAPSCP